LGSLYLNSASKPVVALAARGRRGEIARDRTWDAFLGTNIICSATLRRNAR
jgi:hypothetical protein